MVDLSIVMLVDQRVFIAVLPSQVVQDFATIHSMMAWLMLMMIICLFQIAKLAPNCQRGQLAKNVEKWQNSSKIIQRTKTPKNVSQKLPKLPK